MNITESATHIMEKIKECCDELNELDPASPEARHSLFQLSYNLGRLSELSGTGRRVYDAVKPHVYNGDWEFIIEAADEFLAVLASSPS